MTAEIQIALRNRIQWFMRKEQLADGNGFVMNLKG
jgi:hypothetical protein